MLDSAFLTKGTEFGASQCIPDNETTACIAANEELAIGTERKAGDGVGVAGEGNDSGGTGIYLYGGRLGGVVGGLIGVGGVVGSLVVVGWWWCV